MRRIALGVFVSSIVGLAGCGSETKLKTEWSDEENQKIMAEDKRIAEEEGAPQMKNGKPVKR